MLKTLKRFELNLDNLSDVIIYPYYECNLRCKGCPAVKPGSVEIGFLKSDPIDFNKHIEVEHIERMLTWSVRNWIILGGEPFLSRATPIILSMLKESENSKVIVYTNAVLIYEQLIENNGKIDEKLEGTLCLIDRLIISLEGGREWTDYIRGKGVYDKVNYVIDKIKDYVDVVVRMGYCEDNLISVLNEIKRLNSMDVPVILFPRIDKPPLDRETMYYFYTAIASMEKADILLPSYKNFLGVSRDGVGCPAGWAKVSVTPDGYLTPCQWNFEKIAHLDWRDEDIEIAFTRWCHRAFKIRDECLTCKYVFNCRGSCRVAKDYLECPLKTGKELRDGYVEVLGEVKEVNKSKILAEVSKMEGVTIHGCSAGC